MNELKVIKDEMRIAAINYNKTSFLFKKKKAIYLDNYLDAKERLAKKTK